MARGLRRECRMFLFTTPPQTRETQPANPVVSAIREGAEKTGAGFDYLLKTAQRESALEPDAKAKTSSATGLFQFIEQTWLSMVKQEGPKQGLSNLCQRDQRRARRPAQRGRSGGAREDPAIAQRPAGRGRDGRCADPEEPRPARLALGRQPHAGELYMAHVLGARGASDLIRTAGSDPTRIAARDFPEAAAANRGIFFDKTGKARSAQEVYGVLAASHANTQLARCRHAGAARRRSRAATRRPRSLLRSRPAGRKGLIGLFSTEGSREPVSKAVANLWTSPRSERSRLASLDPADRYFPRQTQSDAVASGCRCGPGRRLRRPRRRRARPCRRRGPVDLTQPASAPLPSRPEAAPGARSTSPPSWSSGAARDRPPFPALGAHRQCRGAGLRRGRARRSLSALRHD